MNISILLFSSLSSILSLFMLSYYCYAFSLVVTRQLKGWWDHYLNNDDRLKILTAVKREKDGSVIMTDR